MCVQSMKEIFPEYADKVFCIENINSEKTIRNKRKPKNDTEFKF